MEKVQLTKGHLELIRAASKEPSRYAINGLNISPDGHVEATDGKMLVRLNGIKTPPAENVILNTADTVGFTRMMKAKSGIIPVIDLQVSGGEVSASSDGITKTSQVIEGTFPKTVDIVPTNTDFLFRLDANLLHRLLDTIIKANRANGKTRGEGIHLEFSIEKSSEANTRPVKIDFTTPGDHKGVAMIMPVKEAI